MGIQRGCVLGAIILLLMASQASVSAYTSGRVDPPTFTYKNGEWYDSWGYNRNYCCSEDGYMPNLAYETLGINKERAYSIGQGFMEDYPDDIQRAKAILKYVQRWTEYGYDEDNVFMGGKAQEEWAWNADETSHAFNEEANIVAIGDCEDMALLCATIYLGAGFDVALVLTTSHVALLIWLPEYQNANIYWDILDGRGNGWIWVEATGESNPLGWTPPDFNDGYWDAFPLNAVISGISYSPESPQDDDDVTVTASIGLESGEIGEVLLVYSVNGGAEKTVSMTHAGSLYSATIPRQATGATVEFRITVNDVHGGTSESAEYSYKVGGLEIPGFPFESIVAGLAVGLLAIYYLSKRRIVQTPSSQVPH
jgi:hypothetical protein